MTANTKLSADQQIAFDAVEQGRNIFLTARAGSGKSFLINHICETTKKPFLLCASTGVAATLIGGRTLHSQFLIGLEQNAEESASKINGKRERAIKKAELLIIDEVSMVSDKLLDCVDEICRLVRGCHKPFGGLQVILVGDFLQLPPVFRGTNEDGTYCIHSKAWKKANIELFILTTNHRQAEDNKFYDILTRVRYNYVNRETVELLKTRELVPADNVIRLYSTNSEVDKHNDRMFNQLDPKTEQAYKMFIDGEPSYVQNFLKHSLWVEDLKLRENTRVMFLANEEKLCNGSLGTIIEFVGGYPRVKFDCGITQVVTKKTIEQYEKTRIDGKTVNGEKLLYVEQVPLKLAYAVSIHKSQGQTFDNAYIDCSRVFTHGQVYVALSRVKSLAGVFVTGFEANRSRCEQTMVDWYIELEKAAKAKMQVAQ
jgi:ATP-dependent exoDNAse (exonuclease V) alpha subunit